VAIKRKDLAEKEKVLFEARGHWSVLIGPSLVFLASVVGIAILLGKVIPSGSGWTWLRWLVVIAVLVIVAIWAITPALRWAFSTLALTTMRIMEREGVLKRSSRDIPLSQVTAVNFRQSLLQRPFGAGTLIVQTETNRDGIAFPNVAEVKLKQIAINDQTMADVGPLAAPVPPTMVGQAPERLSKSLLGNSHVAQPAEFKLPSPYPESRD
jgi:uncharacterized membrane protein YdbT with pleckstrin-like domain